MFARRRSVSLVLALSLTLAFTGSPARADADERALATALFKEGRRLLDAGRVAEACEKLSESQRLDPGGGTLLNLAACHERQGRTATAWAEFTESLAQARRAGRDDRARVAADRVAALEPRLATLRIEVDAAHADGLEVRLDGNVVRTPGWGIAVPVDPGEHIVEANAPGKVAWRTRVAADEARTTAAQIPALDEERVAPAAARVPAPRIEAAPIAAPVRVGDFSTRDAVSAGAAAIGVAGTVVGVVFGARALSKRAESDAQCPSGRCTRSGASLASEAVSAADVSTVSVAVGASGLGAAVLLYLTRPRDSTRGSVAIDLAPHRAWVAWGAMF